MTMDSQDYAIESNSSKLARKAKDSPFLVAGMAGFVGAVAYGIYGFKNRKLPTSIYLIHMRVGAQGLVVGCLTLGVGYNILKQYVIPKYFFNSVKEDGQ